MVEQSQKRKSFGQWFNVWFNDRFEAFLRIYDKLVGVVLRVPATTLLVFGVIFVASLGLFPLLGLSFFPRTDAGQFVINLKAPSGTRLSVTEDEVAKVEDVVRAAANVSIPVFNGHLFSARREAALEGAMESDQRLRDQQQRVSRDVRVAWASTNDAFQRIDVTAQFLRQAALALDLAQGRYNLGLSSIVELTQAQLNLTEAEIENLNAKYDYQTQYAALQYTLGQLR